MLYNISMSLLREEIEHYDDILFIFIQLQVDWTSYFFFHLTIPSVQVQPIYMINMFLLNLLEVRKEM